MPSNTTSSVLQTKRQTQKQNNTWKNISGLKNNSTPVECYILTFATGS